MAKSRNTRLTANHATIGKSLELGVLTDNDGNVVTRDGTAFLKLPVLTTTQKNALTAEAGMAIYDSTLDKVQVYQNTGWSDTDGTAAGSLDAAYNGGSSVTVDSAGITLTSSLTTAALLIVADSVTDGIAVDINADGITTGTILHLDSTAAGFSGNYIDCFDGAASDFAVGLYGATTIAGNAATDVLTVSAGNVVVTSGNITITSGNLVTTSGNLSITGTGSISSTLAVTGVQTNQASLIVDVSHAEAFLLRTNGDARDVLTVDTTDDAADTQMLLTTGVTTGTGLHIDASTITTGDGLKVTVVPGTMTAAGAAISVYDATNAREVFAVRDDGSVYVYGTAEGTTAAQTVSGDMVITDGDLTISGGESSFTDGVTTTGTGFSIISSTTTAGNGNGTAGAVIVTANSLTTGTALVVRADAITTGDMLYLDAGGATMTAGSGFFINCNDDNSSKFTVSSDGRTVIAGTAAGTTALTLSLGDLVITDTDASTIHSVDGTGTLLTLDNEGGVIASDTAVLVIDAGGAVASGGNLLRIAPTGTPNAGAIAVEVVGASKTCQMMYIDGDSTSAAVVAINGGGALTDGLGVLNLTNDGNLATGGNVLNITMGGTPHTAAAALEIAAVKDAYALYIASGNATNSGVYITSNGAIANNKAIVEIVGTGTPANTGSNLLRVDGTGLTATNKPVLIEATGTGKDVIGLDVDTDSVGNVALINGGGNIADNTGVLQLTADGATQSAGGTVLRVVNSGTPNAGSIGVEGVFTSKDMIYMSMAGGSATNSAVFFTSDGAIATTKAVLEVTSTGTPAAATSNVLRVAFTGTATNKPTVVEITGDTKDCMGLSVDADPTTTSAVYFHSAGALAADKATVEVISDAVSNADSAVIRVEQTNVGGVATCLALKQDDVDIPFITFETTIGVGNGIEAVGVKTLTTTHFVMVDIEGVGTRYFPVGTIA